MYYSTCISNFKLFKTDFCPELYLYINIEKYRIALSRFRLSSHRLAIETGRHARPIVPAHQRFCTSCNLNVVGDEIHFLLQCPTFQNLRDEMLNTARSLIPGF